VIEAHEAGRTPDPRAVESVLRALDFAERSMGRDIGLSDLAEAACYSRFYFSRLFIQATGHAPYDYLMRRRVAVAAEEVAAGNASIVDIALDRGFSSPDTFARAFRRCFGLLPSEARRSGTYPRSIARTRISREFVEEALARPFGPPVEALEEAAVLDGSEAGAAERRFDVAQRDENLSPLDAFSGILRPAGIAAFPAYPARSILLAGGRRARFPVLGGPARLALTLEYAYRSWLPLSGLGPSADFDVVEWRSGSPVSLALALGDHPRYAEESAR
jgi:AraC-like DNA-binding protein